MRKTSMAMHKDEYEGRKDVDALREAMGRHDDHAADDHDISVRDRVYCVIADSAVKHGAVQNSKDDAVVDYARSACRMYETLSTHDADVMDVRDVIDAAKEVNLPVRDFLAPFTTFGKTSFRKKENIPELFGAFHSLSREIGDPQKAREAIVCTNALLNRLGDGLEEYVDDFADVLDDCFDGSIGQMSNFIDWANTEEGSDAILRWRSGDAA